MGTTSRTLVWAFLAALACRTVWPSDIGWQIAAGRWILHHGPPVTDVLSYTARGLPWIELRWLWCALVAALWDGPGPWALALASMALHLSAFVLVWRAAGRRDDSPAHAFFLLLAALTASQRLVARPEAVTYVAFAVMLWLLERDRKRASAWVFACVALQVIWINAHTMAFLGPVLCALALGARLWEARATGPARAGIGRSALLLAGVSAACFASPYATSLPIFALQLLAESRDPELRAWIPELEATWRGGGGDVARVSFWILTAVLPLWLLVRRRTPSIFLLASWIVATALAVSSVRHLPLAALTALALSGSPVVAKRRERAGTELSRSRPTAIRGVALVAIGTAAMVGVWLVVTQRFHTWQHDTSRFGLGESPHRYPRDAMRLVAGLRLPDGTRPRVFASPLAASTGLAEGVASHTDLRTEVFGSARLARARSALDTRTGFDRLVAEDSVEVAVADLDLTPFVATVLRHPDWRALYFDEDALVSIRVGAGVRARTLRRADVDSVVAAVRRRLPVVRHGLRGAPWLTAPAAAPYQRFGNLLVLCGRDDLAAPFFRDAVVAEPHSATAHAALGSTAAVLGDTVSALRELRRASGLAPRDAAIRERQAEVEQRRP